FKSFEKYINHPNWDDKGSDVSRLCFESYDEDLWINESSEQWSELEEPDLEDIGVDNDKVIIPLTHEARIIDNLLSWWNKKYGSTKGSRNNNAFRLAAAFNDFGVNQSEAERVILTSAETDFTESEILRTVKSAYANKTA